MKDFSKIVTPLTKLTSKGEKYVWTEKCAFAFERLKNKLSTTPILKTHSGIGGMVIYNDASGERFGMSIDAAGVHNSLRV